jgi:hypothetical protein
MQWYDEENRQRIRFEVQSYQFEKTAKRSTAINLIIIAIRALRIPRNGRSFDYPYLILQPCPHVLLHQLVSKSLSKYAAKQQYINFLAIAN